MMDLRTLNLELCHALGVTNPEKVLKVVLTLDPCALPKIEVHRAADAKTADGLRTTVEMLRLTTVPDDAKSVTVTLEAGAVRAEVDRVVAQLRASGELK